MCIHGNTKYGLKVTRAEFYVCATEQILILSSLDSENTVWFLFYRLWLHDWRSENLQIKICLLCAESNLPWFMQVNNAIACDS